VREFIGEAAAVHSRPGAAAVHSWPGAAAAREELVRDLSARYVGIRYRGRRASAHQGNCEASRARREALGGMPTLAGEALGGWG
jgi:hypothetical protein